MAICNKVNVKLVVHFAAMRQNPENRNHFEYYRLRQYCLYVEGKVLRIGADQSVMAAPFA